jgi:hypothetical protein
MKLCPLLFTMIMGPVFGFSQSTIDGTITDQHGDNLSFVSVFLLRDTAVLHYTETDDNGAFKFEAIEGQDKLKIVASYLKFTTDTITIGGMQTFNLYIDIPDNYVVKIAPHERVKLQEKSVED